jgi:hypothetical protein
MAQRAAVGLNLLKHGHMPLAGLADIALHLLHYGSAASGNFSVGHV